MDTPASMYQQHTVNVNNTGGRLLKRQNRAWHTALLKKLR